MLYPLWVFCLQYGRPAALWESFCISFEDFSVAVTAEKSFRARHSASLGTLSHCVCHCVPHGLCMVFYLPSFFNIWAWERAVLLLSLHFPIRLIHIKSRGQDHDTQYSIDLSLCWLDDQEYLADRERYRGLRAERELMERKICGRQK